MLNTLVTSATDLRLYKIYIENTCVARRLQSGRAWCSRRTDHGEAACHTTYIGTLYGSGCTVGVASCLTLPNGTLYLQQVVGRPHLIPATCT